MFSQKKKKEYLLERLISSYILEQEFNYVGSAWKTDQYKTYFSFLGGIHIIQFANVKVNVRI